LGGGLLLSSIPPDLLSIFVFKKISKGGDEDFPMFPKALPFSVIRRHDPSIDGSSLSLEKIS
jgi:hypothetical protein